MSPFYKKNMNHPRKLPQRAECPGVTPPTRVRTSSPSGSRTRDSGAGGGRSNKERQRLQPLASVARAPLFEVRRVRFTHSTGIATSVTQAREAAIVTILSAR